MSYLYNKNVNVLNNNSIVSNTNPLPITSGLRPIEIAGASEPEYVGSSMVSNIEMIEDSSSDGKIYSIVGYYDEVPGQDGEYELKKVLLEEI